jgi:leucyl/phenylalanyl-tRNA--protein transferase
VDVALEEPNGLLALGGDLTPQRLLYAYAHGIFPWYSDDQPILWWSPDPRMVLEPREFKISRSLRRRLRRNDYSVTMNRAFRQVVHECAAPRAAQSGTWIVPEMVDAYARMHELGHAHSVECWHEGQLAGGLYGVAIGRVFFGESMFSRQADASKVALAHLCRLDFALIDCQLPTEHLISLGAKTMRRASFCARVKEHCQDAPPALLLDPARLEAAH